MQQRKTPMRQCGGCGEMKPKAQLVRVVRSKDGEISLDLSGRKNGRGSYICRSTECFMLAVKRKSFERAFGEKLPEGIISKIQEELSLEQN